MVIGKQSDPELASFMASDAAVANEAPPPSRPAPAAPAAALPPEESARILKRQREDTSPSPQSLGSQHLHSLGSPTKSARLALGSRTFPSPPPPLTGAAALEDERRRHEAEQAPSSPPPNSDNPSHRVLASLLAAGTQEMSRPIDAPQSSAAPTANMESAPKSDNSLPVPAETTDDRAGDKEEANLRDAEGIAGGQVTASPTPMDVDNKTDNGLPQPVVGQEERSQPSSLSYPGSLQAGGNLGDPSPRGMTFPMPSHSQTSPASSGPKKHKCPYCSTEFTRHHNLKSHLLTHSQEKPYVCTQCPLRFRRLHDLKRHSKLHTGDRPHVCPKCDRKFARGDALARHSKGAGGCAGRRSSMGSFADGDDMGNNSTMGEGEDSAMSGLGYDDHGGEEELRRQSMPTGGTQHVAGAENEGYGAAHSRTYPPAIPRPGASGLYPPNVNQQAQASSAGSSSGPNSMANPHTPNTSVSSGAVASGNGGMYSQSGVTESPKALSPAIPGHDPSSSANHQRSPGVGQQQQQQQQQQQLGRRPSEHPSPHSGQPQSKLLGLSHPGGYSTTNSAGYSHGRTPSGTQVNHDSRNMFAQSDPSVWAYIQGLEDKVKNLTDKVLALDHEVTSLKEQRDKGDTQTTEEVAPAAQI